MVTKTQIKAIKKLSRLIFNNPTPKLKGLKKRLKVEALVSKRKEKYQPVNLNEANADFDKVVKLIRKALQLTKKKKKA